MNPADERITWALRFADMDLSGLSSHDWQRLNTDLAAFLFPWQHGKDVAMQDVAKGVSILPLQQITFATHPEPNRISQDFTEDDFRRLQEETRELLRGVTSRTAPLIAGKVTFSVLASAGRPASLQFNGAVRECFLLLLSFLMIQPRVNRIRRCSECGNFFQRIRKQRYCSPRCTKRVAMRTWRQTPKGKANAKKQARKRYERLVQKKTPGAQPQRYRKSTLAVTG